MWNHFNKCGIISTLKEASGDELENISKRPRRKALTDDRSESRSRLHINFAFLFKFHNGATTGVGEGGR